MKEKKETRPERRTQVKDLPKEEQELTKEEQKKVKGGATMVEYALLIINKKAKTPEA